MPSGENCHLNAMWFLVGSDKASSATTELNGMVMCEVQGNWCAPFFLSTKVSSTEGTGGGGAGGRSERPTKVQVSWQLVGGISQPQ